MKVVFVSSTFKDMNYERDMLKNRLVPLFDKKLESYGESIYFGDLRWGVDTTGLSDEESSKKVLSVCLDEIDNSRPYMIVLLGDRYGWIPAPELLSKTALAKGIKNIPLDISVTQLEIEYGALLNPEYDGRIFFYIRNLDASNMSEEDKKIYFSTNETDIKKMDLLKKRIREIYPNQVREYHATWNPQTKEVIDLLELEEMITEDLNSAFQKDIDEYLEMPWQERIVKSSKEYLLKLAKNYVPSKRFGEEKQCVNYDDSCKIIITNYKDEYMNLLEAADLYKYTRDLYEEDCQDLLCIPFVFGITGNSFTINDFIRVLLYKYEYVLGLDIIDYEDTDEDSMIKQLLDYEQKCYEEYGILLNAHCVNANEDFYEFLYKHEIEYNKLHKDEIVSVDNPIKRTTNYNLVFNHNVIMPIILPYFDYTAVYHVKYNNKDTAREYIKNVLLSNHKELDDSVIEHILKKKNFDCSYLSLIVKRLTMLDNDDFSAINLNGGGMDSINNYLIYLIDEYSDDEKTIVEELLNEAYERINPNLVKYVLLCLYVDDMSQKDISSIINGINQNFSDLDFSIFTKSLSEIIIRKEDKFAIRNSSYKLAVLSLLKKYCIKEELEAFGEYCFTYKFHLESLMKLGIIQNDVELALSYFIWADDNSLDSVLTWKKASEILLEEVKNDNCNFPALFIINLCIYSKNFGRIFRAFEDQTDERLINFYKIFLGNLGRIKERKEAQIMFVEASVRYILLLTDLWPFEDVINEFTRSAHIIACFDSIPPYVMDEFNGLLLYFAANLDLQVDGNEVLTSLLNTIPLEKYDFGKTKSLNQKYMSTLFKARIYSLYKKGMKKLGIDFTEYDSFIKETYMNINIYSKDKDISPFIKNEDYSLAIEVLSSIDQFENNKTIYPNDLQIGYEQFKSLYFARNFTSIRCSYLKEIADLVNSGDKDAIGEAEKYNIKYSDLISDFYKKLEIFQMFHLNRDWKELMLHLNNMFRYAMIEDYNNNKTRLKIQHCLLESLYRLTATNINSTHLAYLFRPIISFSVYAQIINSVENDDEFNQICYYFFKFLKESDSSLSKLIKFYFRKPLAYDEIHAKDLYELFKDFKTHDKYSLECMDAANDIFGMIMGTLLNDSETDEN